MQICCYVSLLSDPVFVNTQVKANILLCRLPMTAVISWYKLQLLHTLLWWMMCWKLAVAIVRLWSHRPLAACRLCPQNLHSSRVQTCFEVRGSWLSFVGWSNIYTIYLYIIYIYILYTIYKSFVGWSIYRWLVIVKCSASACWRGLCWVLSLLIRCIMCCDYMWYVTCDCHSDKAI